MRLIMLALLGGLLNPAMASGAVLPGGWQTSDSNGSCAVGVRFEGAGGTIFIYTETPSGKRSIGFVNDNWSIEQDRTYTVDVRLDGVSWPGQGMGFVASPPHIQMLVSAEFRNALAKAKGIDLYLGDGSVVDRLSMKGSAAALAAVDACLARVRAEQKIEQAQRARIGDIPRDPFAHDRTPMPAMPKQSPATWVGIDDYPTTALCEGRDGMVGFSLQIDAEGTVSACTVTSSSGSADLDEATCAAIRNKARFNPARNATGEPTVGSFESKVHWTLPDGLGRQ